MGILPKKEFSMARVFKKILMKNYIDIVIGVLTIYFLTKTMFPN